MAKKIKKKKAQDKFTGIIDVAIILHREGRLNEARRLYGNVLEMAPRHANALHLSGLAEEITGSRETALTFIDKAILSTPDNPTFHYNRALLLQRMGRVKEAIESYNRSLKLEPGRVAALENLLMCHINFAEFEKGMAVIERIKLIAPESESIKRGPSALLAACWFPEFNPDVYAVLQDTIKNNPSSCEQSSRIFSSQIMMKLGIDADTFPGEKLEQFYALAENQLLHDFMGIIRVDDNSLELTLLQVRRMLLFREYDADTPDSLVEALAVQAFINEYVWLVEDDEKNKLDALKHEIEKELSGSADAILTSTDLHKKMMLYALYAPFSDLAPARKLISDDNFDLNSLPSNLHNLFYRTVICCLEEERLKGTLESIGEISNETSKAVKNQYEESPFPRWTLLIDEQKMRYGQSMMQMFPTLQLPAFFNNEKIDLLVAGCGTGQHPVSIALKHVETDITAVDLSRSSLAYAVRMSKKLGIRNIRFMQGDILDLGELKSRFDIIECCGVLHHMKVPMDGLRVLVNLLNPGGMILLGLYSSKAREAVSMARDIIRKKGIGSSKDEIRAFRHRIITNQEDEKLQDCAKQFNDFYSLSECRDLLFHVQEHQYTLKQIGAMLSEIGLKFAGFKSAKPNTNQVYAARFPDDKSMTNLENWVVLEQLNPTLFTGMYQFWSIKVGG